MASPVLQLHLRKPPLLARASSLLLLLLPRTCVRHNSSTASTRWLSEQKLRLGRLFFHGTTAAEACEAAAVLRALSEGWRRYVAASEGFLVAEKRRGLFRHAVGWGEMVWLPFV